MMKKITGSTRSLLNLAKPREKGRTRQNLGKNFPTKEPRDRFPDHQRERVEDELLQGLPKGSRR